MRSTRGTSRQLRSRLSLNGRSKWIGVAGGHAPQNSKARSATPNRPLRVAGLLCLEEWRGDRQRHAVRLRIVAIGQDDHAQVALRIAHDDVAESDALAGMPERLARDAPAEAVLDRRIVGPGPWREGEFARRVAQQAVVV